VQPNDPLWTDLATTITAIAALLISLLSLFLSWKQHSLTSTQERRRKPALMPDYLEGYFSVAEAARSRTYHIRIAVRNPTDTDNSVARVELGIGYRLPDGSRVMARIPVAPSDGGEALSVPQRIAAHETVAGWYRFVVDGNLIAGRVIDSYAIEMTDSHEQLTAVTPLLLSERSDVR
jgi:hypothetical protein